MFELNKVNSWTHDFLSLLVRFNFVNFEEHSEPCFPSATDFWCHRKSEL